jgi:hypothetical protein
LRTYRKHQRKSFVGADWPYYTAEEKEQYLCENKLTEEEALKEFKDAEAWLELFREKKEKKIEKLNEEVRKKSVELGLDHPFVRFSTDVDIINVIYQCSSSEIKPMLEKLFSEFNKNISEADSLGAKMRIIADLYQTLEWIHPFHDGQGRTDLILLSKLLSEHGANPPLLPKPFVSTFNPLDDWVDYLNKGIKSWQEAYFNLSSVLI